MHTLHSVHWVSTPLKTTPPPPLSFQAPPLNQQTLQVIFKSN